VRDGLLPVVEECVRGPDFAGKKVVERETLHRSFEPEPFIFPALSKKHIYGIFLRQRKAMRRYLSRRGPYKELSPVYLELSVWAML
jgi:hypothetical protein